MGSLSCFNKLPYKINLNYFKFLFSKDLKLRVLINYFYFYKKWLLSITLVNYIYKSFKIASERCRFTNTGKNKADLGMKILSSINFDHCTRYLRIFTIFSMEFCFYDHSRVSNFS